MVTYMQKIILVVLVLIISVSVLFGCTFVGTDTNSQTAVKINSQSEAIKSVNDVSSDVSGIANSLDDIDQLLTDTNA